MWPYILCLPFCLAANWTDWKSRRIPNLLSVTVAVAGLVTQLAGAGPRGVLFWLAGLLPAFVLLPFFGLRMLGAGDIKLLAALGSVLGFRPALILLGTSLLANGVLGMAVMLARGCFMKRFRVLGQYLKFCLLTQCLQPYTAPGEEDDGGGKFAFSYGITCGLLLTAVYFYRL